MWAFKDQDGSASWSRCHQLIKILWKRGGNSQDGAQYNQVIKHIGQGKNIWPSQLKWWIEKEFWSLNVETKGQDSRFESEVCSSKNGI